MNNPTINQINQALENLPNPNYDNVKNFKGLVHHEVINEVSGMHAEQGTVGETLVVIKSDYLPEGWFIKFKVFTDSYGNNEHIRSIKFVKGVKKRVTVFEYE